MSDKIDFTPAVDFEPIQETVPKPEATPVMDTVQKTLELGGTVFGGMAGATAGTLADPVVGPAGTVGGGIVGAGLGRAAGTSFSNVIRNYSNPSQTPSLGDQLKDVASSGVQGAKDQATGEAVGAVAKPVLTPVISRLGDTINAGLAKLSKWRLGASVPEKAAEIAQEAKFNLSEGSQPEIEKGVENVQKALTEAKDKAGAVLNKAKSDIGIPTSIADREASLVKYGNPHGLGSDVINADTQAMLDSKSPEELSANIAKFKQLQTSGNEDPALTARVANALQDKINNFVDWQKTGSVTEGVLKQQYKDLGNIVTDNAVGLQGAKGEMSKVLNVFDDLKGKLDSDTPGKAEQFLRNLFTKDNPTNRGYLDKLAQLEHISGKPVLSDLFKQFTGESFSNTMGSPKLASAAAAEGATALMHLNPFGTAASVGYLGAQSPALIKTLGKASASLSEASINALKSKLAPATIKGLISLKNDPELQSFRDKYFGK